MTDSRPEPRHPKQPDLPRPSVHDAEAVHDARREPDAVEDGLAGPREVGHGPADARGNARTPGLTEDGRFRSSRLAGLTMGGAIWVLSWPVTVESFLNSAVGLTDTWLASQMGVPEADAIAGASYIMWFIGLTIMALGIGATALVSRAVGASRMAVANAVLTQSVMLALTIGVIVGVVVALGAGTVAGLLNMGPAATDAFRDYMTIIAVGAPAASLLFVLIACARGAGDSVRPLQAMAVRNVVNIAVSWALSGIDITVADADGVTRTVLANPFGFDMGIAGIAIGTVAGDLAGTLVVLRMALVGSWGIRIKRRRLLPHRTTIARLIRLGVPNFLETLGMWVGNFLVVILVGWMGAGLLGAHMIAIRIEALSFLPGFAMGIAAATLAGQYLGAKRPDLARRAITRCAIIASVIMGLLGAAFITIPETLTGLISSQDIHLERTPDLLFICGLVQIPFAISIVMRQAMRGAGDVRVVMALTWTSTYLIRLPLAYLLSGADVVDIDTVNGEIVRTVLFENPSPLDWGLTGLLIGLCIDLLLRGVIFLARYLHGGWTRVRV